ncbi:phosphotransferase [Verrucomicrobiota bacterium]
MNAIREEVKQSACALLGQAPEHVEQIKGGGNNICLKVRAGDRLVLAKKYFIHEQDQRDRLGAEFSMLSFLWQNGIRCVPEPLAKDNEKRIAFYEFIIGSRPTAGKIDKQDVERLCDLLGEMWRLKNRPGTESLPAGSDASFAIQDYIDCIQARLDAVQQCAASGEALPAFREFVKKQMAPMFERLMKYIDSESSRYGLDPALELTKEERTLNPADHGFHNAIRRKDGSLVFIDFEYAGWDDPAQMICNACLQPEVPIPSPLLNPFLREIIKRVEGNESLLRRLRIAYPLLAFKWCLIMLNEFLPVSSDRRQFAGTDPESRQTAQLAKSRKQLGKAKAFLKDAGLFDNVL